MPTSGNELVFDAQNQHLTGTTPTEQFQIQQFSSSDPFFNPSVAFFTEPPPYRAPPSALSNGNASNSEIQTGDSGFGNGNSESIGSTSSSTFPESPTYHTHSAKFPIVKEVIYSASASSSASQPPNLNKGIPGGPTPNQSSRIPVWSPGEAKRTVGQLGWPEDRRAFTLDSRSAKELQDKFQTGSQRIVTQQRRNSLDLEKFIQVFNEEQALLASMQQGRQLEGGIDNPALDVGHSSHHQSQYSTHLQTHNMYNGGSSGKMSGYFPDSSNSSQSQSLSSSNTDSLDTVIYKGPTAQQGAGSIRDWQHRSSAESNPEISLDFNHRSENNSHRDTSNHMAYQMQQQQHQYQHSPHYNGNGYTMDYRSPQSQHQQQQQQYQQQMMQQQHQHQGLSVQSLQHTHQNGHQVHNSNNNGSNGLPMNSSGMNMMRGNVNPGYIGSNPQLSSAKSPTVPQKQFSTPNGTNGADPLSLDKAKESNKQFPAKTYNHIKDMISSRFGNVGSGNNNASANNHSMSYNNTNGLTNGGGNLNSQIPNLNGQVNNPTVYSAHNGDLNLGLPNTSYGLHHHSQNSPVNTSMSNYYNGGSPATVAYYGQPSPNNGGSGGVNNPNSYRNDTTAADRKNVNTSFRKAIQKSTQKSNLVEDSVQLRTISEVQAQNQANSQLHRPQPLQQYSPGEQTGILAARAQKALDKLCETSKQQQYTLGSNLAHQQQHIMNGDTVKQPTQSPPPYPDKAPPPIPQSALRITDFSLKSSLSPAKPPYPKHNAMADSNSNAWNSDLDQPPPLPLSQKPQTNNSVPLGLPSPLVSSAVRENGDGSSGSADATKCLSEAAMLKSEKLKQMSTEMHNLALSVASEHHQSSSSDGEIKGSQRVGSGQSHTTTDSGHGTVLLTKSPQHSGDTSEHAPLDGLIGLRHKFGDNIADSISSGNDSEWVDIVEPEIRQILELERASKSTAGKSNTRTPTSTNLQQSQQHLSLNQQSQVQGSSADPRASSPVAHSSRQHVLQPSPSPKLPKKFDLNVYNKKTSQEAEPSSGQDPPSTSKTKTPRVPANLLRSNSGSGQRPHPWNARSRLPNDKGKSATVGRKELLLSQTKAGKLTRNAMSQILYSLHDDNGDMTSTTTGLDLESMLDGPTENTSDDDDLSTTIDTTDAHAIRRQLESLESMYTEVLKVLGAKKFGAGGRYPTSDLRNAKRRPYGSMSSLPSSVSSRPFRNDNKKKIDDKKKVKDIKSINRRFQRLESHVVTLARSVAHLSSEMRTQHLMVQEMESIRNELSQLRSLTMKAQNQSAASAAVAAAAAANGQNFTGRGPNNGRQGGGAQAVNTTDWTSFRNALPSLTNPCRVRKLTKFFGDEPPLIRIFLKKLGYEKYASHFEQERIGIMELPYLTEERLQKMGIPMGPRLRILQEAHLCLKPGSQFPPDHPIHNGHGNTGNLSVYVV